MHGMLAEPAHAFGVSAKPLVVIMKRMSRWPHMLVADSIPAWMAAHSIMGSPPKKRSSSLGLSALEAAQSRS